MWAAPSLGLGGVLDLMKGENQLNTSIHLSRFPDCRCNVTDRLLPPCLPHHGGLHPETVSQNKPLLPLEATKRKLTHVSVFLPLLTE